MVQLGLEHSGNGGLEIKDGRCPGIDRDDQVVDVEVHLVVNIAGHGDPNQIPYRDFEPGDTTDTVPSATATEKTRSGVAPPWSSNALFVDVVPST